MLKQRKVVGEAIAKKALKAGVKECVLIEADSFITAEFLLWLMQQEKPA